MIYYYPIATMPLYALLAYVKNAKNDRTRDEERIIATLAAAQRTAWEQSK